MTEKLYSVGLTYNATGNKLRLYVWAVSSQAATGKLLTASLIGPGCNYTWRDTSPEYDAHGNLITREVD